MDVLLCCRPCGLLLRVPARAKNWPICPVCSEDDWIVAQVAPERVAHALDEDAWKGSYDDWKTGGGNPR